MAKNSKSLWLKDFEQHISAQTALAADDLVQAGKVKSLREVEQHFWVGLVEDGAATYETESIITPNKIKAYTCECFSEGRQLMCAHIAASLLRVRHYLAQRAEEREAKKTAQAAAAPTGRLTVRDALENVSAEALQEFVREYARLNRDFSLALKTYFAGTITDAENPYALVLDTAISKRTTAPSLRDPDFRRLLKTLDHLSEQVAEAVTQHHYRTTYLIASALLQKLTPVYEKVADAKRDVLSPYLLAAFEHLCDLHESAAPPELREATWMLLLDWSMSAPLPTDFSRKAIRFLSKSAGQDAHFEDIRLRFDQTPHPAPVALLVLFLAALSVRRMPQAVVRVLEDYVADPNMLHACLLDLYYQHHSEAVLLAGDRFLPATAEAADRPLPNFSPAQRRELEDILLYLAERAGDRDRQIARLRLRLRQNAPLEVFQRLKALLQDEWPAELQRMSTELRQSADRGKLATLLAADGAVTALADWLSEDPDFTLFQRHEGLLLEWDRSAVRDRYVAFLAAFLTEHFGLPASAQVRMYLQSLMRRQESALVKEIVQALVEAFPDRLTLSSELMELFPKSRGSR